MNENDRPNPSPVIPTPGRESVWDYPRPPRLEPTSKRIRVVAGGVTLADSTHTMRMLETSHPPVYYIPKGDIRMDLLRKTGHGSVCEWKGNAEYYTAEVNGKLLENIAWSYPNPRESYGAIRNHLAFYAGRADFCYVDDERVVPQPGEFYGGWITSDIAGPFKGERRTEGW